VATFGLGAALAGNPSDDGVPVTATLTTTWTQVGGPGTVTFDDASAANTIAHFDTTGIYELLLTADDGELVASDALFIDVWNNANVPVAIDIQPFDSNNEILPSSDNPILVAVLGTSIATGDPVDFDSTQVDPDSLKFGPGEATSLTSAPLLNDVNSDGNLDAIFGFSTLDSGIVCNDTEATLTGSTYSAEPFSSVDTVMTIDCTTGSCHP
jgi:hypothetical protein